MNEIRQNSTWFLMSVLGALMAFTSVSVDFYLPAMPQMQRDLGGDVELTITGFLIGFALSQLFWGPLSDKFGRKRLLLIGLALFTAGSVGCALSTNITQILLWRILQAMGASTGSMLARAMIRDLYDKTRAAQMLSTLVVIMAVAPIMGPLLGGWIIKISTWHTIFWVLSAFSALLFIAVFVWAICAFTDLIFAFAVATFASCAS